jgi:site-specific DNA-methyltransferase (adenine-specific)
VSAERVEIGGAVLIRGDCREVLGTLAEPAQLCLTDPPYGNVVKAEWDRFGREGFPGFLTDIVGRLPEIITGNGSLFWFCYPSNSAACEVALSEHFRVLSHVVWRKGGPARPAASWAHGSDTEALRSFFPETERIIFCEQSGTDRRAADAAGYDDRCAELHKKVYSAGPFATRIQSLRVSHGLKRWQVDVACSPSRKPTGLCYRWEEGACNPTLEQYKAFCRLIGDKRADEALRQEYEALRQEYEALRRPFFAGRLKTDLWEFQPPLGGDRHGHPCEKPVPMLVEMIRQTTRPDDLVIDPFMGVGGVGVACIKLGRRFVGIEQDRKWFGIAERRIRSAVDQADLFIPQPVAAQPKQEALFA